MMKAPDLYAEYLIIGVETFLRDPPNTDFQAGYLTSLLESARIAKIHHPSITAGEALLARYHTLPGQKWLTVVKPEGRR